MLDIAAVSIGSDQNNRRDDLIRVIRHDNSVVRILILLLQFIVMPSTVVPSSVSIMQMDVVGQEWLVLIIAM